MSSHARTTASRPEASSRAWPLVIAALALFAAAVSAQEPPAEPAINTRQDRSPKIRQERNGDLVFRNEHLVALLVRGADGYGPLYIYPATRPTQPYSRPIAVAPALAEVGSAAFRPTDADVVSGGRRVVLRGGPGGAEVELSIDDEPWLAWQVRAQPAAGAGVSRLAPLPLLAGHAGWREALFPGVAFVEGDPTEPRSPQAGRTWTGEPYEITVPLIAISQGGSTVAQMWDPRAAGPLGRPGASVRSPAPDAADTRHRIEVFAPAGDQPVDAAGEAVTLRGRILVLRDEGAPAQAIRQWHRAFIENPGGRDPRVSFPTGFDDARRKARAAYVRGTDSSDPTARGFAALALLMEAGFGENGAVREQADRALARAREAGPLEPLLAYRAGGVLPSLDAEARRARAVVRDQLANGGWPLPSPEATRELGDVTRQLLPLLRYAALTGDSDPIGAATRALELIDPKPYGLDTSAYRIPKAAFGSTAAGSTELSAAAEAVECFLLAYQVTGERSHLDAARYWADSGLAFVYHWGDRQRPALFGAARPFFGREDSAPVTAAQPVGLEFARALLLLDRVRPDDLHERAARAILASALAQQNAEGLVPTGWQVRDGQPVGPPVLPDGIINAMYALWGYWPDVDHVRLRAGADRMFVASGAVISRPWTSSMRVRLDLKWLPGEETFTTITGVTDRPVSVEYNSRELLFTGIPLDRRFLPEVESEAQEGWHYDPERAMLILRLRHTGRQDHLEVRWQDPRKRYPVERVDLRVNRRR
jgi:hypothetical protein